ncbi:ribulose-1,5 bisphosphate carboxylase/oxygenase large subunit N-methyltransferase, chloroplastic isoform X5 [Phoenix dactylifera]|uniref:Ribulose-1,5 bisphosphate carboxylase/oxygenase large subunit N-methyltransferase, chloroplastic isoform X5 n=1 Tax=Phoenix dactylifera TaxID=42345 RepID=A0A8B7C8C3_PHODC|nr:ribulose-1,5 bisphosphate carboxylase/oxygenase large subunit N-methyltransferase, chloroplastic isoform X5 [Phoenix dactylifera]
MRFGSRIAHLRSHLPLPFPLSPPSYPRCKLSHSASAASAAASKDCQLKEESNEFLSWLQKKAGVEISSMLSIGNSVYGRSLFASKYIRAGDCILKVPYNVQMTSDRFPSEIEPFLVHDVGNISRLAVVLLAEQKLGQNSGWATYISNLPRKDEMHNTIFWSKDELEMIRSSPVYQETFDKKAYIVKEFSALRPALEHFPQTFGDVRLEDFMHAYALVTSRAWATSKGIYLIPFADFLNHDGTSDAILLSDEDNKISEVMIRYGKFSNATLLLDFGFTLPYNTYDQVQIWMDAPFHDPLYQIKLELLQNHCLPRIVDASGFNSSKSSFVIKEVKSTSGKGQGIPQALRAYCRVLSATSLEELKALTVEAAENDGRLARRTLTDRDREIQAHRMLLSQFIPMIEDHDAALKVLESSNQFSVRRQMAKDLLKGELRVLQSACAWLTNYCENIC